VIHRGHEIKGTAPWSYLVSYARDQRQVAVARIYWTRRLFRCRVLALRFRVRTNSLASSCGAGRSHPRDSDSPFL
jgi:hypothetical protein